MSVLTFVVLAIVAGMMIPLQTSLNALLGRYSGHPLMTTLLVFIIGGIACSAALLVVRPNLPTVASLQAAPAVSWSGGLFAMLYVVVAVSVIPKLGVGFTTTAILVGQMVMALTLDHYGLLGNATHPINAQRLGGIALMVMGMALIKRY